MQTFIGILFENYDNLLPIITNRIKYKNKLRNYSYVLNSKYKYKYI